MKENVKTRLGSFLVQPIRLCHNAENYGFIITHPELGKLVYAVDCSTFQYRIKDVAHWIIEANHDVSLVIDKLFAGCGTHGHSENHLSFEQAKEALVNNHSEQAKTIILAHLSDGYSDESIFANETSLLFPNSNVYVADVGMDIEL